MSTPSPTTSRKVSFSIASSIFVPFLFFIPFLFFCRVKFFERIWFKYQMFMPATIVFIGKKRRLLYFFADFISVDPAFNAGVEFFDLFQVALIVAGGFHQWTDAADFP